MFFVTKHLISFLMILIQSYRYICYERNHTYCILSRYINIVFSYHKTLNVFTLTYYLLCRKQGVKVHVANSGAIINKIGVDLDYVRPGIAMYGQPPG